MGPYQRTFKEVVRAIRYSGLGVRSVGPVGDFLEYVVCFQVRTKYDVLRGKFT